LGFGHNAALFTGTLTNKRYESPLSCRINESTGLLDAEAFGDEDFGDEDFDDEDFDDEDFDDEDFAVLALGELAFAVLDLVVVALAVETRCVISPFGSQRFVSLLYFSPFGQRFLVSLIYLYIIGINKKSFIEFPNNKYIKIAQKIFSIKVG